MGKQVRGFAGSTSSKQLPGILLVHFSGECDASSGLTELSLVVEAGLSLVPVSGEGSGSLCGLLHVLCCAACRPVGSRNNLRLIKSRESLS